ncbi:MAG: hypothetical protein ACYS17_15230 [Planctomycetota bacterium]|jgi:hypothetical protein
MPSAFGRLPPSAPVTCVPLLRIGTARPPPFGRRGKASRSKDSVERDILDVRCVVGVWYVLINGTEWLFWDIKKSEFGKLL